MAEPSTTPLRAAVPLPMLCIGKSEAASLLPAESGEGDRPAEPVGGGGSVNLR